jgi:hypothetical protein
MDETEKRLSELEDRVTVLELRYAVLWDEDNRRILRVLSGRAEGTGGITVDALYVVTSIHQLVIESALIELRQAGFARATDRGWEITDSGLKAIDPISGLK